MASCPAFDPSGPYVGNVVYWADCRILSFGADGYAALGPSSPYGAAWTGVLTILIALFGYRLLLTGTFALRDVMVTMVKLGAVLALAGQWPAYRTLVFDVFTSGPAALTSGVLVQSGPSAGGLAARVDGVDAAIADLIPPPRPPTLVARAPDGESVPQPPPAPPAGLSVKAQANIESASWLLSVSALGGLLSVRLVSGVLLGLGPLFVACLLFPVTQGLFIGWLRGLIGAGLGSVMATLVLAMELAILEPQVIALRDLVDGAQDSGMLPAAIYSTGAFFAVLMGAALVAVALVAAGLRLPTPGSVVTLFDAGRPVLVNTEPSPQPTASTNAGTVPADPPLPSRAQGVAAAFQSLDRREAQASQDQVRLIRVGDAGTATTGTAQATGSLPLGQSARRTGPRKSATADRRDEFK
jgi:type IV secretion system protein VirB6